MAVPIEPKQRPSKVRSVYKHNLEEEMIRISHLIDDFPFVSMDTEFPGVVHARTSRAADECYRILKKNVDDLKLIQLGLTLSDASGRVAGVWEFNFADFDAASDLQSAPSIDLLRRHGIDFERNLAEGVEAVRFAELAMSSGLACNGDVTWIAFHGSYDFAYLVKVLSQRRLPEEPEGFFEAMRAFFPRFVDVKRMCCEGGVHGGLDRVADAAGVCRTVGGKHQAGSDSLLTSDVYWRLSEMCFPAVDRHVGVLFGLEKFCYSY
ncbi:hypothetical protein QJS10_CPB19g00444 [Acorus calamus]|uniref:poly(A)-specific ribonuclease n=1 Tax=Acorus calamus TaxID=4465 RepID=A0AAV9CGN2_ACOCL|nr:hypothetical protein QJS10_CPB19g00444 [Acorus calamus]